MMERNLAISDLLEARMSDFPTNLQKIPCEIPPNNSGHSDTVAQRLVTVA